MASHKAQVCCMRTPYLFIDHLIYIICHSEDVIYSLIIFRAKIKNNVFAKFVRNPEGRLIDQTCSQLSRNE